MRIIRQKLDGGTVFPKKLRYNETTDTVEETYDNGETWVDNPLADPRTSPAFIQAKPPRDTRCDIAANVHAFLQSNIQGVIDIFTDFGSAAGAVGAIVSFFMTVFQLLGPFGVIITLFFALATYLVEVGGAAIEYAFEPNEWDKVLCNILDDTPSDGIYTQEMLDAITARNTANMNATAALIINGMLALMGTTGTTNAGKTGTATADCTDCTGTWCYTFDFLTSNGFFDPASTVWGAGATWAAGVGWQARINATRSGQTDKYSFLYIGRWITGTVTEISVTGSFTYGTQDAYSQTSKLVKVTTPLVTVTYPTNPATLHWTGSQTWAAGQALLIDIGLGYNNTGGLSGGTGVLTSLTLRGTGENPFGADNC